jgi:hypothetical protein
MATQTLIVTTSANTAPLSSTKVKVVANNACYYAIDGVASATANVGAMIPANFPVSVNMGGIDKRLAVASVNGTSTGVTVTEIGTVYQSALNQNSTTFLNT